MGKLKSSNPIFVDLFYSVVVGSAIAMLSVDNSKTLAFQIAWVIAVLEDWYLYYSHVVDEETGAVTWNFKSLLIEFGILTSWFLGFNALSKEGTRHLFFYMGSSVLPYKNYWRCNFLS